MKKAGIISMLLAFVLAITGCANVENIIIIKTNGYGSQSVYLNVNRTAYLKKCSDGKKLSDSEIADIDANFINQGATIQKKGTEEYYRMPVVLNNKMDSEEMVSSLYIPGTVAYVTGDTFYWNVCVARIIDNEFSDEDLSGYGVARSDLYEMPMTLTIQFSAEIVRTNGNIISDNGKSVTFEVSNSGNAPLFATTNSAKTQTSVVTEIAKLNKVANTKFTKLTSQASGSTATVSYTLKKKKSAFAYQIQYSTTKSFKKPKTMTVTDVKGNVTGLKKGKKYYFRARVIKTNYAGIHLYGKWSSKKKIKTKK